MRLINISFLILFFPVGLLLSCLLPGMSPQSYFSSFKKSWLLSGLQRKISSFSFSPADFLNFEKTEKREKLENKYIHFCATQWIPEVCRFFNLTEDDLKNAYNNLATTGAAQYAGGHFVALSALSYVEPAFFYFSTKEKQTVSNLKRSFMLVEYFRTERPYPQKNHLYLKCKNEFEEFIAFLKSQNTSSSILTNSCAKSQIQKK